MCPCDSLKIQDAKNRHLRTIARLCRAISSQRRHFRQSEDIVKQQYLLHMSLQYGEFRPTVGWDRLTGWGTPANFNGFHVLASLLQRRCSTDVNQTLHDVRPSHGQVNYSLYTFSRALAAVKSAKFWVAIQKNLADTRISWIYARTQKYGSNSAGYYTVYGCYSTELWINYSLHWFRY